MTNYWRILTEEESVESTVQLEREAAEEAERQVLVQACKQMHDHEWVLELPESAEGYNGVELKCLRCPAGVDDVYPDGYDMIYFEHGDVKVEAARHNSPEPLTIPVTVDVVTSSIWSDYGLEYDVELVLTYREPK